MIKSFTIVNFLGESLKLELGSPEKSGFLIQSVTGIGPAKADINKTEVVTNDGALYNSARVNSRNIVFNFIFTETEDGESIEDVRHKSYKYFPLKKGVDIIIETDKRLLKASGYVESNEVNIFSQRESAQVSIVCPDPYFYSYGEGGIIKTIFYGVEPKFEFPFANVSYEEKTMVMGELLSKTKSVIYYPGDSEVGIMIYIHALDEAVNPFIYNIRTNERMTINTERLKTLTGSALVGGDDIIINTAKGEKSIILKRDNKEYNILNCLGRDTDWFLLSKGDNVFAFGAEDGTANLQFYIENKVVYEGV